MNRQPGFRRGGLVEQDILNFFILDVDIFNLKNLSLYASVRQKRTKVTKETIQTFGHPGTNNKKNNIHNTNNKNTEQAKTCKILNRTHSKGNVPKTTTQRSHNHHNKVIYEYQNKRHAQEHNRETLKTTKHIKITRSQKKTHKKDNQQTQPNEKQKLHGMNNKPGTTHYTKYNTPRHKEETEHISKMHTSIMQKRTTQQIKKSIT